MNELHSQQVADAALVNMLRNVPPEVAQRITEKYEADREVFLNYVKEHTPSQDPAYWAKRSCTKCNGRGILGTLVKPSGETVVPACSCTSKNYAKWLIEMRQRYNAVKEQGHEKTAD